MAFDEKLAARVRLALTGEPVSEKKMVGGLCFMVRGHMCIRVDKNRLMVRVGADAHERALKLKHAVPMDFIGRAMRGFIFVEPAGCTTQRGVDAWVRRGLAFVTSLAPKSR